MTAPDDGGRGAIPAQVSKPDLATSTEQTGTPDSVIHAFPTPSSDRDCVSKSPDTGSPSKEAAPSAPKKSAGPTQATLLAGILERTIPWHTPDGEAFASFPVAKAGENMKDGGHIEHWRIRSKNFRDWLAREFYKQYSKTPSSQAIEDTLRVAEGQAQFDGPEMNIHLRTARHESSLYIDLGDEKWRAVKCTRDGWEVIRVSPPIPFRRSKGMLPLPEPKRGVRRRFSTSAWLAVRCAAPETTPKRGQPRGRPRSPAGSRWRGWRPPPRDRTSVHAAVSGFPAPPRRYPAAPPDVPRARSARRSRPRRA